jgi:5-methylcytosine-specific restriction endonuclease McrA
MASHGYYFTAHWKQLRKTALRRDGYRCTAPSCLAIATVVDHIVTRSRCPYPTAADTLGNLRSLCSLHDKALKERPNGRRRTQIPIKGCDVDGWPYWLRPNEIQ